LDEFQPHRFPESIYAKIRISAPIFLPKKISVFIVQSNNNNNYYYCYQTKNNVCYEIKTLLDWEVPSSPALQGLAKWNTVFALENKKMYEEF
jgi:hypothetical protein